MFTKWPSLELMQVLAARFATQCPQDLQMLCLVVALHVVNCVNRAFPELLLPLLMLLLYFAWLHRLWIALSGCCRFIRQNCVKFHRQAGFHSRDERNTSSVKLTNTFIGQLASHWELDLPTQSQGGGAQMLHYSDTPLKQWQWRVWAGVKEGQCLKWVAAAVKAEQQQSLEKNQFFLKGFHQTHFFLPNKKPLNIKRKWGPHSVQGQNLTSVIWRSTFEKSISDSVRDLWRKHGESPAVLFRPPPAHKPAPPGQWRLRREERLKEFMLEMVEKNSWLRWWMKKRAG